LKYACPPFFETCCLHGKALHGGAGCLASPNFEREKMISREEINQNYPFDSDNMTQDDYDDLNLARYKNNRDEIERITKRSFEN
jgi:hypothetical protein